MISSMRPWITTVALVSLASNGAFWPFKIGTGSLLVAITALTSTSSYEPLCPDYTMYSQVKFTSPPYILDRS